ncbi:hypothetical protein [Sphingomonas sp. S2-65]|uniref:hypothetical protein n=1 Tax=Sphingomonas sp. S2-65 TaxID=2903960 RepID=UPI001F3251BA|nr:hypothetical protein [Sphingomonas sp. S2-65]UYY57368.1 hypothetical protein LZ586_11835 [Sphingomonas sp. S2-65]
MTSDFDSFQRIVLADQALQAELDTTIHPDDFAGRAARAAEAVGLNLDADALRPRARIGRVPPSADWAPPTWLPAGVTESEGGAVIDWARFGAVPLTRSFFTDSVREALCRPFNRVFRHQTALDAFIDAAAAQPITPPAGLVFHMSRCGSTLVAQMLGALEATTALSEPEPFDSALRLALGRSDIPRARRIALLRGMAGALARGGTGGRCFLKLDSWHILALPLFREAFPRTPWIYLFRDPVEVLVSQMRMRGYQTVPALMPKGIYDLGDAETSGPEMLCARIFAQYHAAAIQALQGEGGLAVDYAALPAAFEARIVPHFGLRLSDAERRAVADRAARDAKAPGVRFTADDRDKRQQASAAIRRAAAVHLAAPHAALRALASA